MDYQKHYDALMCRARNRVLTGYKERHHIIPKCIGGDNKPENLVCLTPEEHYVAHQLLVKIHPDNEKLIWAACNMAGNPNGCHRAGNKLFGWIKRRLAAATSKRCKGIFKHSEEAKAKMLANREVNPNWGMRGKKHSEETKKKMAAASKGRKKSKEHCEALSRARKGKRFENHYYDKLAPLIKERRDQGIALEKIANILFSFGYANGKGSPFHKSEIRRILLRSAQ